MQRVNGDTQTAGPLAVQQSGGLAPAGYQPMFTGGYRNQPTMPGGQPERAWPTLTELVNALKRRLVLATFLGVLVGVAAASAVWLALPSGKHKVRARVQVRPQTDLRGNDVVQNFDDFKAGQQQSVKSRSVLHLALQDPLVSRLPLVVGADDPALMLEGMVQTAWETGDQLAVSMTGDDWKQMELLVTAVVNSFIESAKVDERKDLTDRRRSLEAAAKTLDDQINHRLEEIRRLQRLKQSGADPLTNANLVATAGQDLNKLSSEIADVESKMRLLNATKLQRQQEIAALDTMPVEPAEIEGATQSEPAVIERRGAVQAAEKRLRDAEQRYEAGAPGLQKVQAELRKAETDLRAALETLRPQVEKFVRESRRKSAGGRLRGVDEEIDLQQKYLDAMLKVRKGKEEKLKELVAGGLDVKIEDEELKPLYENRTAFARELVGLTLREKQPVRVVLREPAVTIINQNWRQKVLVALGSFAGGTLLVMAAVGFLEWRTRRVDSVDQVVNELGMRVIGTIPAFPSKQALKSGDAAQSQNWRFVLNESVNSARTMLLHTAKTQEMQVLMVTSAMQGEGKTSLASQLATSMATAGLRTLILDCDLRNPSMHKLFDAPLTPGCSEVLCQEVDVSDAVQPTSVPNLWLIPAGQCSNRVISALAQGHPLETLFNRLRGQFDFIVVDSCPVLPVADTLLVGQHVDGVVLSILQDISQLPKVQTTADRLTQLNIPLLGTVVNGIKPDVHAYGYNYVKQLPA